MRSHRIYGTHRYSIFPLVDSNCPLFSTNMASKVTFCAMAVDVSDVFIYGLEKVAVECSSR